MAPLTSNESRPDFLPTNRCKFDLAAFQPEGACRLHGALAEMLGLLAQLLFEKHDGPLLVGGDGRQITEASKKPPPSRDYASTVSTETKPSDLQPNAQTL
ncbi:hypothetical protein Q5P01_021850 [Channa striata]|uniref:Uncharacterized protein n=1 Tax=Channa striata TaxID=64152 RepID=A0AA88RYX5_CHASR|nr:hypothetical protein Q5P01_021850 [Channa striata]